MEKIGDILMSIAFVCNCIMIHTLSKRVDNTEQWINYLLKKDDEFCAYIEHRRRNDD